MATLLATWPQRALRSGDLQLRSGKRLIADTLASAAGFAGLLTNASVPPAKKRASGGWGEAINVLDLPEDILEAMLVASEDVGVRELCALAGVSRKLRLLTVSTSRPGPRTRNKPYNVFEALVAGCSLQLLAASWPRYVRVHWGLWVLYVASRVVDHEDPIASDSQDSSV